MNPYNLAILFFSFCTFFIGLLILLKRSDRVGRIYFVFSCLVTHWGFFYAIMISQTVSYDTALMSARLAHGVAAFIPVTWLHFTLVLTHNETKNKIILQTYYLLACVVLFSAFTPWFIPSVESTQQFKYYIKPGSIFHLYSFIYFTAIPLGFVQLAKKVNTSSSEEKIQFQGLVLATVVGFGAGGLCFLPVYKINLPQYNIFFMSVYPFAMAYFMMRHRLFDLETIVHAFQREKLAAIGLIAASVNHEIRNPLYAAKEMLGSYIEILKEGKQNKDPLQTSEKIKCQIDRALEVITKLNRFAKPVSDSISLDSRASIPEAIQNVLDLVSYESSLDRIKIDNQINLNISQIQADQRQLEEILFNLIVNACYAMPNGGTLVIASELIPSRTSLRAPKGRSNPSALRLLRRPVGTPRNDMFVQITISDTGTGIPQDQMKHLFEPFHTTKEDKGTGLGLYITKQLVERNGGKIAVSSEPNQGTSFVLEFKTT